MFKVNILVNKKDYFSCSMFYIRKYISAREFVLLGVLFAIALLFWITLDNILILVMFGIILLLMFLAVLLFVFTALAGYKSDFTKHGIVKQSLIFSEWGFTINSIDDSEQIVFSEKIEYIDVDKIALRKDRIYLYGGVALPFYIFPESVVEGDYNELRLFLIGHLDKSKFKMKSKVRQFPFYPKKKFDKDLQEKLDRIEKYTDDDKK